MSKDQRVYLLDLLDRIERIETIAALGEANFRASFVHQDAVIRSFEVIGEIVKRLDPALLTQAAAIDWSDYAGFRDVLIHQYDRVLLEIVWESTQGDLTALKAAVQALLALLPPNNP